MLTQKWTRLVFLVLLFATVVQIAGLVSPLWIYLKLGDTTVGVGLYYRVGCGASTGNNCTMAGFNQLPFGYNSSATYEKDSWEAIVWLETISASFGVILCVMMVVYLAGFGAWKKMNNLNIAMVIVAILSWLPLAVGLIIYIIYYGKVITRSPETSSPSFPWSPVMCLVAGVLFFILTFLIRCRCRNRNYIKNAIPTSTDSKIALNPSTKNPLMKRYFTPSPYREERRQALYSSAYANDKSRLLANGSVVGAIENTRIENTTFGNQYSRAIEYNVVEGRQDVPMTQVIQTNNLSAGAFAGGGVVTNGDLKRTIYDRDVSSFVNKNATGNYGTEVVNRTYVTRTVGVNEYGNQIEQAHNPNYRPVVNDVNRQSYTQRQWTGRVGQDDRFPEMNVVGNNTTLNRGLGYDTFSEMDAETVYYTGKEGFRPITLNRSDSYNTSHIRSAHAKEGHSNGYVLTREIRQPLQPVQEEQTVTEVTVIDRSSGKMAERPKSFRLPADHNVVSGIQKASDYTVHTRTITEDQRPPQLVLAPGYLSGKRFNYNGKYIYRPYSESSY